MRIWSVHPRFLDSKGLVACWRESLLAKHVLEGKTRGYKNHSQLVRFKNGNGLVNINYYLSFLFLEAERRGFNFSEDKFDSSREFERIFLNKGQLIYEFDHLRKKLEVRCPSCLVNFPSSVFLEGLSLRELQSFAHPLFSLKDGSVEDWEIV
jgi:hypothetical protein